MPSIAPITRNAKRTACGSGGKGRERLTIGRILGGNKTRRNGHKQNTLLPKLGIELGNGDIKCALADGVGGRIGDGEIPDEIWVGHARRDGDDLLGMSLADKWQG